MSSSDPAAPPAALPDSLPRQTDDLTDLTLSADCRATAQRLVADGQAARRALKAAKAEKGQLQRRIGERRKAGEDIGPDLKEAMADAAKATRDATAAVAAAEHAWRALHAQAAAETDSTTTPHGEARPAPVLPVRILTLPAVDDAWTAYADAHPDATLYHSSAWLQVLEQAFHHPMLLLAAEDAGGRRVGILPVLRQRSRLFGDFATALPFGNYGGVVADDDAVAAQLLEAAGAWATEAGVQHVEFRHTKPLQGWPARTDKVCMLRDLPATATALDAELGTKLRAQVRKGLRNDPEVVVYDQHLLDDFYRVYCANMRDLGTPPYHKGFFRAVLEGMGDAARCVVLYQQDRPVGAAILLRWRDTMEIPWAATLRRVHSTNANMALYWHVLCHSIQVGCTRFDFGRSTVGSGTWRFKKQWGAEPVQLHWHYWLPEGGEPPRMNPDNPRYRLLIRTWQHLPVWVTRLIGPPVVRSLP